MASPVQSRGPQGARAPSLWRTGLVAWAMWHLSEPGIDLVFLALQGRFLTTEPPGSPVFPFNGSTGHHTKATSPRNEFNNWIYVLRLLFEWKSPTFFISHFFFALKLPLLRITPLKSNILQLCEQCYSHIHIKHSLYKLFLFHCRYTSPEQITTPLWLCLRIFHQYTN